MIVAIPGRVNDRVQGVENYVCNEWSEYKKQGRKANGMCATTKTRMVIKGKKNG